MFDDEVVRPVPDVKLGADLTGMSIEDLEERITALKEEIARAEDELGSKRAGRAAAEAVFGGR